jgi:phospholipase/carboxylesterase
MRFRPAVFLFAAFLVGCGELWSNSAGSNYGPPSDVQPQNDGLPRDHGPPADAAAMGAPANGGSRAAGVQYLERIAGGAQSEDRLPLVLILHGRGGRPERYENLVQTMRARARVILPYGEPTSRGYLWYHPRIRSSDPNVVADSIARAEDRLAGLIAELSKSRPTVGKAVVCGHSQGGVLAYALAVRHPELVGTAVPLAGQLPPPLWPSRWADGRWKPRIAAFHGDQDTTSPVENDRATAAHLRSLGLWVEFNELPGVGHRVSSSEMALVVARVEQAAVQEAGAPTMGALPPRASR